MKTIKTCLMAGCMLAAASFSSCQKPQNEQPDATVSIEMVEITDSTAEFSLTLKNATTAYWLVEPVSTEQADADKIKNEGTVFSPETEKTIIARDLAAGNQYRIMAVAENEKGLGNAASYDFQTDGINQEAPVIQATLAMGNYYGTRYSEAANYYFMLTDCEFTSGVAVTDGMMLYFDCYAGESDTPQDAKIPSGKYQYVNENVFDEFKISKQSTVFIEVDSRGNITSNLYPVSGQLDVQYSQGSGYQIEGSFMLEDGREVKVYYNGDFQLTNQSGVFGEDITITAEHYYSATYFGDLYGSGACEYYFEIGTMLPDGAGGAPVGSGYALDFDLWGAKADDPANAKIPEGTYEFSDMIDMNVAHSDRTTGHCVIPDGTSRYRIPYTAGSVNVKHNGDGYDITGTFTLGDGYKLTINYSGILPFENQSPAESDDLDITFASGSGMYLGDIYDAGTANFTLEFLSEDEATMLTIDVNDVLDDDMDLSEGTYTVDEEGSMEAGKFYTGTIDIFGVIGTFVTVGAGTENEEYLLITGGTFDVKHIENGYRFDFHFTMQDGTKIEGEYEGPFIIE